MKQVIEEEATKQYAKFLELPENHHLKRLTEKQYNRPRLKSKGKVQPRRMDWRTKAAELYKKIGTEDPGTIRNSIHCTAEKRNHEEFLMEVNQESDYYNFCTREENPGLLIDATREERVLFYKLRLNRWAKLEECKHRFGQSDSPMCTDCNQEEETALHFLLVQSYLLTNRYPRILEHFFTLQLVEE